MDGWMDGWMDKCSCILMDGVCVCVCVCEGEREGQSEGGVYVYIARESRTVISERTVSFQDDIES